MTCQQTSHLFSLRQVLHLNLPVHLPSSLERKRSCIVIPRRDQAQALQHMNNAIRRTDPPLQDKHLSTLVFARYMRARLTVYPYNSLSPSSQQRALPPRIHPILTHRKPSAPHQQTYSQAKCNTHLGLTRLNSPLHQRSARPSLAMPRLNHFPKALGLEGEAEKAAMRTKLKQLGGGSAQADINAHQARSGTLVLVPRTIGRRA